MQYNDEFVKKQKNILLEEKKRLKERISKLKEFQDYGFDDEDNAQEISDYENNLSIEEQMSFLLAKVNKAILSIENKTYGQCSKCQKSIEEGRLEIMPYAELCVTCKDLNNG